MAESLNVRGNSFYKQGKYLQALTSYHEASKADPTESKYFSNLSAVCYELGQYSTAIENVTTAWKLYGERHPALPADDAFAIKLATRYAKAKVNVAYEKSATSHRTLAGDTYEDEMRQFATKNAHTADVKVKEMLVAWQQYETLGATHVLDDGNATRSPRVAAAEKRLRALSIYKQSADPTLEYYTFSHDSARSLLNGLCGGKDDQYVLDTKANKHTKDWSFLFGGSGDGRHSFTTLQHLAAMKKRYTHSEMNVHLTLVDTHPAPLARTLVVFALLHKIVDAKASADKDQHLLLHATLFHAYNWHFMPEYCCTIFVQTCRELVSDLANGTSTLLPFLHINSDTLEGALTVLRYWSQPINKSVAPMLQHVYSSTVFAEIEGLPPIPGMEKMPRDPRPRKPNAYDDYEGEKDAFLLLPVLLPPRGLVGRHPALEELTKTYTTTNAKAAAAKAKKEVLKTWKLNPSIFDNSCTEHPNLSRDGYPLDIPNPFKNIDGFAGAVKQFQLKPPPSFCAGSSSFDVTAQYFEMVADAIDALRDGLKIEILLDDVMSGVPKLVEGDLGPRPDSFPKEYTRMWLCNVPDYTQGFLGTAVHLLRYLQPGQLAISNILLNNGVWRGIAEFCYGFALLHPTDFPRFLGCEVVYTQMQIWDEMALRALPLPRQLHKLASKKELHDWLARLLLCLLCNGELRRAPSRVPMPANLGMFFHLLVYLRHVGFPAHWIGDFVQALVSDTLLTDARPYIGVLPITEEYARQRNPVIKVNLSPWRMYLEVIIASCRAALPFAVALPSEFPGWQDISVYTAKVKSVPSLLMLTGNFSQFHKTLGMVFYKPSAVFNGDAVSWRIIEIIDGRNPIKGSEAQIILNLENVNLAHGEVSWRMSRQWYEKMRAEGWVMEVYRDDSHGTVTEPLPATKWHRVDVN